MHYKITRKSRNGKMLELVNEKGEKDWYFLDGKVAAFSQSLQIDDEIEIKSEEREEGPFITFITKKGSMPIHSVPSTGTGTKTYGKSPEEQESIKKQAVLKASADAVATAMAGQVNVDTLADAIEKLFDRLYAKINS